jgi:excisionase family DNA binding protein
MSSVSLTQDDWPRNEELLSPTTAAAIAGRSVRTIRRAYRAGTLVAYRDGNGRGVRIRYDDLRQWMMAGLAASPAMKDESKARLLVRSVERSDMGKTVARQGALSENLALLQAARAGRN